eukprot:2711068-Pleurochrysis_carterae.AAC.1
MPEGLANSQPTGPPNKRRGGRERPGLPRDAGDSPAWGGASSAQGGADAARPGGAIAIADLFRPGIYAGKVEAWFREADAA